MQSAAVIFFSTQAVNQGYHFGYCIHRRPALSGLVLVVV